MDTNKRIDVVDKLLERALTSNDPMWAVHFTQAACNAVNAIRTLKDVAPASNPAPTPIPNPYIPNPY